MSGATLFISSCAIVALTIVNLGVGPSINSKIGTWSSLNCLKLSDKLDEEKENNPNITETEIEEANKEIKKCKNRKTMYEMEYTSFIFNAGIGFICTLLGLFGLQKEMEKKTGIIGMALGVIGFVLTLVYVIYNGIVYTNYYDDAIFKIDGDGAVATLVDGETNKYKCLYFKEANDTEALYAKYSDLIKSQYNYNRELIVFFNEDYPEKKRGCNIYGDYNVEPYKCDREEFLNVSMNYTDKDGVSQRCEKLYNLYEFDRNKAFNDYSNYDKSARFLCCLILSIFTLLCYCGMAFSGFMLFKGEPGEANVPNT